MPWSMIHLSIAVELYGNDAHPAFLLGSIAPDAVQVREPGQVHKSKSHLWNKQTRQTEDLVMFYESQMKVAGDAELRPFLLGYISHILADTKWGNVKRSLSAGAHADAVRERLWTEENQNDFHIYRQVQWRDRVIDRLQQARAYEIPGLYSSEELQLWRKQAFDWYEEPQNEPRIEIRCLQEELLQHFIIETSEELAQLFQFLK